MTALREERPDVEHVDLIFPNSDVRMCDEVIFSMNGETARMPTAFVWS